MSSVSSTSTSVVTSESMASPSSESSGINRPSGSSDRQNPEPTNVSTMGRLAALLAASDKAVPPNSAL